MTKWLVQGLIPSGSSVALMGELHSGKAWFAEQLAVCVAGGHDFLDSFRVEKQHVILIDEGSGTASFKRRFERLARGLKVDLASVPLECYSKCGFLLYEPERREWLRSLIKKQRGTPLVIIDNLDLIMDEREVGEIGGESQLAGLCHDLRNAGATMVIVHQTGAKKRTNVEDWDVRKEARGFTVLIECFDLALAIFRAPTANTEFVLKPIVRESGGRITRPFSIGLREDPEETWARLEVLDELPELKGTRAHDVFPEVVEPFN
ncbi:MAG: AAA family ATPase [Dehalococcoidia bacterium]|nr:AAA family ATPase [Dehalococcoidia bacterium]